MPRKVKSIERWVGRGSGRAGGWLDIRLDMGLGGLRAGTVG